LIVVGRGCRKQIHSGLWTHVQDHGGHGSEQYRRPPGMQALMVTDPEEPKMCLDLGCGSGAW
jgi:hypothetical protein